MSAVQGGTSANVVVTGANGFIGGHLCVELARRGCAVTALSRSVWEPDETEIAADVRGRIRRIVAPGLGPDSDFRPWLQDCDAVVHLAGRAHVTRETADAREQFHRVNVELTERIAHDAAACGVRRFVYLSSVGVLGNRTRGEPFHRASPVGPIEEYAVSKLEAERRLAARFADSNALVVVRPPLVYGPGAKGNFARLLRLVQKLPVLPFGRVRAQRSYVHVANLCSFLHRCLDPAVPAGAYLVCDDERASLPDVVRIIADELGARRMLLPFSASMLRLAGRATGRRAEIDRLLSELIVNNDEDKQLAGWAPEHGLEHGLREMVRHFKAA